jgi:dTDP-4-dehydrorhamnose 3,5-epimerase
LIDAEPVSTPVAGAYLLPLPRFPDARGWFSETFRSDWLPGARPMVQANLSFSRAGVLRGLHFHRRQADYWWVCRGRMLAALYDLRAGSPTQGARFEAGLGGEDGPGFGLFVPPGVAHGFLAESDVLMQYMVDHLYDGEDEFGVAWDDPALGIDWRSADPVLSDRDRANPPLDEILRNPPSFTE